MHQFRSSFAALALVLTTAVAVFVTSATAQTPKPATPAPKPAPTSPVVAGTKVGLIDTGAFDAKDGLTRYSAAMDQVDVIFKKDLDDLRLMNEKFTGLEKELAVLQQQLQSTPASATVPVNPTQLQATYTSKAEEYERVGREYKFRQEDVKVRYQAKRNELVGPILQDIGVAIGEFAKQNGFAVILDLSKLGESGMLITIGDDSIDVTKQFIAFYNARTPKPAPVNPPLKK